MGSPYLNNNESIILSTHNVVINTIPAEAILTNQRLILVDARHTQLRPQDISFAAIETVTIGDNSAMDPVLSISVVTPDDIRHQLGIVFTQLPKTRRVGERDEWAVKVKDFSNTAQHEHAGIRPAELLPPWVPGDLPAEEGDAPDLAAADEKFRNPPLVPRKPKAPAPGNGKMILAGGILVLVIIIALTGYLLAPSLLGTGSAPTVPVTTSTATAVPTIPATVPMVIQTPVPALTLTPSPSPVSTPPVTAAPTTAVQNGIPQSGIWVQVSYAGNFTGSVGTPGRMNDIAGNGDRLFRVPAQNEIVEATVQKADDSGNVLTVTVYNNGAAAQTGTISSPHGTLDIHADLRSTVPVTTATVTTKATNTTGNKTAGT